MLKTNVYDMTGKVVGEIELDANIFGVEVNEAVMHAAVKNQLANKRQGTHSVKGRSEVSGGGKKPYRQKGTGRARVGSIRSPLWVGGGTVFGPTPRSHAKSMNRKARQLAVKSALSEKLRSNEIVVLDKIGFAAPKTKDAIKMLAAFHVEGKALIIDGDEIVMNTVLSARTITGVKPIATRGINIYDLVHYTKLFITKSAVEKIEEVLA